MLLVLPSHPVRNMAVSDWDRLASTCFECTEERDESCAICLDKMEVGDSLLKLPCAARHAFHVGCAGAWLSKSSKCPLDSEDVVA